MQKEIDLLKRKIALLTVRNSRLKAKLTRARSKAWEAKRLNSKLKCDMKKAKTASPTKVVRAQVLHESLSPFFTNAQISCFQRGHNWKRVKGWGKEDFKTALSLRMLSNKAYEFIRNLKAFPLPGNTTLQDYFGNFRIAPGFLDSVAELISFKIPSMDKIDRITAISFDEMHLTKAVGKTKKNKTG